MTATMNETIANGLAPVNDQEAARSEAVYKGIITGQVLTTSRNGDPQLQLTVNLTARLANPARPGGDLIPVAPSPRTVRINFTADGMDKAARYLVSLGFKGEDIGSLQHGHPKFQDLSGTEMFARASLSGDRVYWNIQAYANPSGGSGFVVTPMTTDQIKAWKQQGDNGSHFRRLLAVAREGGRPEARMTPSAPLAPAGTTAAPDDMTPPDDTQEFPF